MPLTVNNFSSTLDGNMPFYTFPLVFAAKYSITNNDVQNNSPVRCAYTRDTSTDDHVRLSANTPSN